MRRSLDRYYTPDRLARALVAQLPIHRRERPVILEPHAGGGAFVRAALAEWPEARILAGDVDPVAPAAWHHDDPRVTYRNCPSWGWCGGVPWGPRVDWIIGNPPYLTAELEIRRALALAEQGAAFLVRQGFLSSAKRREFWAEHRPAAVYILSERPTYPDTYRWVDGALEVGDRGPTDLYDYCWCVWHRHAYVYQPTALRWVSWRGVR